MIAALTIPFTDFEVPIEIVALGAITGLTYGLLAIGLTLIYRATRVLNFAHGALGAFPALLLPVLVIKGNWNYWLALVAAIAAGALGGALLEAGVIRRLRSAPRLIVMVATIAAAQILTVVVIVIPKGDEFLRHRYPTPFSQTITLGDLRLGPGQLMILAFGPVLALGLTVFLNKTRMGLGAKASAENTEAALLTGVPVKRVSLVVWSLAGVFAAASAILVGGTQPLGAQGGDLGPSLLVRGLAAAMLGGLESLPIVFVGGIAIGVIELLVQWNYPSAGMLNPLLFGIILVSLLVHKGLGQAARGGPATSWSLAGGIKALRPALANHPRVRRAKRIGLVTLVAGTALLANTIGPGQRVLLSSFLIFSTIGLSLTVLTGFAGQISLGQYTFVSLGAVVAGRMAQLGFPSGSTLLYAIAGTAVVAVAIGLPALRVRGLFLAVVTLAFGLAAEGWLFNQKWLVKSGFSGTSLRLHRPDWFGIDFDSELRFAWLCLAQLVLTALAVHRLRSTGIGRAMIAVRDNEPAAATLSLSPRRVKIIAFVIAGVIAGIGGYFYAALLVNFGVAVGGAQESINLVVMVILGGVTTVTGSILGAAWIRGIPYAFGANAGLLSSAFGVLVVLLMLPGGLAGLAFRVRDAIVRRLTGLPIEEIGAQSPERKRLPARPRPTVSDEEAAAEADSVAIAATEIVVRFGGNTALNHVSVHAKRREILGLLGPNGAGKTTLFDVLSGQVRPTEGRVELNGMDITDLRPEQRTMLGLGRTFQQARLFDELTVFEAVEVALEREAPSEVIPSLFGLPPSRRAEARKRMRARELIDLIGLGAYANRQVTELSTGMRRMLELGCVVGVGADVVLLDEPTAGIAQAEVERFTPVIREIRDHLDATLVIVEHDIPLMMSLVERMYVLAAGEVIAEGPPQLVRNDPAVIAAYVGDDARVVERSGARSLVPAATSLHIAEADGAEAVNGNSAARPRRRRQLAADDPAQAGTTRAAKRSVSDEASRAGGRSK